MTNCHICLRNTVVRLLDLGKQPVCNKFLKSPLKKEFKANLLMGLCESCGLVQLIKPFPQNKLQPINKLVKYNEPEEHLNNLAIILSNLLKKNKNAKICGLSYKDASLINRLKKRGFKMAKILDMREDLGLNNDIEDVVIIQNNLITVKAKKIVQQHGKFDLVIARHILEHSYNSFEFINSIKKLIKTNGYIVFEVPDNTKAFEIFDYSIIWEEHILYFTPETFKNFFTFFELRVEKFKIYPYILENSLIAIVKYNKKIKPIFPSNDLLRREKTSALIFSHMFVKNKKILRSFLSNYKKKGGKIAIFGAGHTSCLLINIFGLSDYVDYVIDDNPNKQGFFMPGSHLPIVSSFILNSTNINLCILSINPKNENMIIAKNDKFLGKGGRFLSLSPISKLSLYNNQDIQNNYNFRMTNNKVYYATHKNIKLGKDDIKILKKKAKVNKLDRIRLCCHKDSFDNLHEMFILLKRNTYIRPHMHLNKSESLHVLEGSAYVVIFDKQGNISEVIELGNYRSRNKFYYRMDKPIYHTLIINSDFLVFHETTVGPFRRKDTLFAPWAPKENDTITQKLYINKLRKSVQQFLSRKKNDA